MRLFPARTLLIDRDPENGGLYVGGRKPYVIRITDRGRVLVGIADLRALGYRFVSHDTCAPAARYARPWALWALLKTTNDIRIAWWQGVWSLYRHGVFHLVSEEGTEFRWRDVRPGPDRSAPPAPLAPLTREDIEQEMTRIQEEHYSADPANMLRVFSMMAEDSDLDEQTRELARVAIEELERWSENVGPNG